MTTSGVPTDASRSGADALLRDYHDARRREDQWRIPQLLSALVAPIAMLISLLFLMGHMETEAIAAGAVGLVSGLAAALLAVETWRWHRTALSHVNRFRTEYPADAALLLNDPL